MPRWPRSASLPDAYRETLMLRLVEGLTGPEIAERTGLTPASVRVNLHRGMKLLRTALNRCEPMTAPNDDTGRDDYLWDGTGEPDPDVARLETLLAPYRHRGPMTPLPQRRSSEPGAPPRRFAVHAAMQIMMAAASLRARRRRGVVRVGGAPVGMDGAVARRNAARGGHRDRRAVDAADRADRDHRRGVARAHRRRLDRRRGRRAEQPPAARSPRAPASIAWRSIAAASARSSGRRRGLFFVNTPSATAVDLGCAYRLDVDDRGWGKVHVESGWVAFEYNGRESFIPKDAMCATRPGFGPGTPCYEDAPAGFAEALTILDFSPTQDVSARRAALDTILREARRNDALTLWHLVSRGTREERMRVYDRLASLVPPPDSATRERVARGDRRALDEWWDALGLDSASWWRIWKRKW